MKILIVLVTYSLWPLVMGSNRCLYYALKMNSRLVSLAFLVVVVVLLVVGILVQSQTTEHVLLSLLVMTETELSVDDLDELLVLLFGSLQFQVTMMVLDSLLRLSL